MEFVERGFATWDGVGFEFRGSFWHSERKRDLLFSDSGGGFVHASDGCQKDFYSGGEAGSPENSTAFQDASGEGGCALFLHIQCHGREGSLHMECADGVACGVVIELKRCSFRNTISGSGAARAGSAQDQAEMHRNEWAVCDGRIPVDDQPGRSAANHHDGLGSGSGVE